MFFKNWKWQMKITKQTYIEFMFPWNLYKDNLIQKIGMRDASMIKIPKGIYGLRFFDIIPGTVNIGGERIRLKSKRINVSPMFYYGDKVYTIAEFERKFPNEENALCYVEDKKWEKIIVCCDDEWREFKDTDVLI
ncbi:hypothetical protein KJ671_02040 [Patescibacteria group bacterium]|nr:hypothetical protein [Patescibacteria group bacterium]